VRPEASRRVQGPLAPGGAAMRLILSLLGTLTVLLGAMWILQGFSLFPIRSMMNGDHKWALYGACLALGGFVLMGWARRGERGDPILAYMHLMLAKARERGIPLHEQSWRDRGAHLPLFDGVEGWFDRQNARARDLGFDLRHFIISSGNREIIEGSPIARHFER